MPEINNEDFNKYFMERSYFFLGRAFVAWIESLQQVAYNLALQEYNETLEGEKTLENEEEYNNDSNSTANHAE